MKNFEESLRQLNAPDLKVNTFQQTLHHDLTLAGGELSRRRWRLACFATSSLSVVLLIVMATIAMSPTSPNGLLAGEKISAENDRKFIESYYAREGDDVRVLSINDERFLAVREFTMSNGQQMVVYTEVSDDQSNRSASRLNTELPMLASQSSTTF